ncbi:MAG: heavy metal-binding domain-containing protein [Bacteroidia bacterium]
MKPTKNIINVCFETIKQAIHRGFITYTCTNHPEIIVNEPGVCPECGKDLVKKY